jgi:hypothetical protein
MKRLVLILTFFLVSSCDSSESGTNQPDGGGNIDELSIVSLGKDSVYWGETSWLVLNEPRNSIDGLQLYVQTHPMIIDSCVNDKLYFRSGQNAESGSFRLYSESKPTKGDQYITFLQHDVKWRPEIGYYGPYQGYVGDRIWMTVVEMPFRRGDWDVYIGDTKLDAEYDTSRKLIIATISGSAQNGVLKLRTMSEDHDLGEFTVLRHKESFLKKASMIRSLELRVSDLVGQMEKKVDQSSFLLKEISALVGLNSAEIPILQDNDTIRARATRDVGDRFDIELAIAEDSLGILSGRAVIVAWERDIVERRMEAKFSGIAWYVSDGGYTAQALGPQVNALLKSITFTKTVNGVITDRVIDYTGSTLHSHFRLSLVTK